MVAKRKIEVKKKNYTDNIILGSIIGLIAVVVIISAVTNNTFVGIANPASVNCVRQGYTLDLREGINGTTGYCIFDDGSACEEWAYLRGECSKGTCIKWVTGIEMSIDEALAIALASDCVQQGNLTTHYFCNSETGTWWIDLDVPDPGLCNPACVVDMGSNTVEVNWRCTGLIEE